MNPIVASTVDRPLPVLAGLTATELTTAVLVAAPCAVVLGLLIFAPMGVWLIGLVVALPITALIIVLLAQIVRTLKRGRPTNWLEAALFARLSDYGLMRCPYLRHDGPWEVRR